MEEAFSQLLLEKEKKDVECRDCQEQLRVKSAAAQMGGPNPPKRLEVKLNDAYKELEEIQLVSHL